MSIDRIRRFYGSIEKYEKLRANNRLYAMFNHDRHGNIVGYCNDSFCMSYRYHCVHIWDYPPLHYFDHSIGDFIIVVGRQYDDIKIMPLTTEYHTFKGNYLFEQKVNGIWSVMEDKGKVGMDYMKNI